MKLSKLIAGMETLNRTENLDVEISGISIDHRNVKTGDLFVCIKGYQVDGHEYMEGALQNGAVALIVQKDLALLPPGIPSIQVENCREALAFIATRFYECPSKQFKLVGITGTKGKTTSSYMVRAIAQEAGCRTGMIGTVETFIYDEIEKTKETTPGALDLQRLFSRMNKKNVDFVVMEVSSQGLALDRVKYSDFDIGVFSNLYRDHISENEHSNMEEYLEAKLKLFNNCKTGIVNADCDVFQTVKSRAKCSLITYAINQEADVRATEIENIRSGNRMSVRFRALTPWFDEWIDVGMPGAYNVYNALSAIAVSGFCGFPIKCIKNELKDIRVRGRIEPVDAGQDFVVLVDYAHNAASLKSLLEMLRTYKYENMITVFGCGGDRAKDRRFDMGEVSGEYSDLTIITSDNPRSEDPASIMKDIETGIRRTNGNYVKIEDRGAAIQFAVRTAKRGDLVVIAGKGHETTQTFKDKVICFDDVDVAYNAILFDQQIRKGDSHEDFC